MGGRIAFVKPSTFEVEIAIEKFKSYKSPGIDQFVAGVI
jgi:hypothetical protein